MPESKRFYDVIFEKLMEKFYGIEFNSSVESSVEHSLDLFKTAKKSIWVADGKFESGLWQSPKILESLNLAASRGVDVRILSGPEIHPTPEIKAAGEEGTIKFHQLKNEPNPKFTVVDEDHIRIEDTDFNTDNYRKAFIVKNSKMLGKRLAMDFTELWKRSHEIKFK